MCMSTALISYARMPNARVVASHELVHGENAEFNDHLDLPKHTNIVKHGELKWNKKAKNISQCR